MHCKSAGPAFLAAFAVVSILAACGGDSGTSESGSLDAAATGEWSTHEELVAAAKQEGGVKVLTSIEPDVNEALIEGFERKYPEIDLEIDELENQEGQKLLLELQSGQVEYDSFHFSGDNDLEEWKPYLADIDLAELVANGVVDIPKEVINSNSPNMMSAGTGFGALAYNKKMIPEDEVPSSYEEVLDPKWRGQLLVQIDGDHFIELFEAWGPERGLEYATQIAKQDPVWTDSNTAGLTVLAAGEVPMFLNTHYQSAYRLQQEHPDTIGIKLLDPIPGGFSHIQALSKDAKHPAAAVLFYEYLMSAEAQNFLFELEPVTASVYVDGSEQAAIVEGRELSILDWHSFANVATWGDQIESAFGFPTSEVGG
jgi:iron(III) transport system substrate-binding protein